MYFCVLDLREGKKVVACNIKEKDCAVIIADTYFDFCDGECDTVILPQPKIFRDSDECLQFDFLAK